MTSPSINWSTGFTADTDGLLIIAPYASSGNYYDAYFKINNSSVEIQVSIADGSGNAVSLPLKKGDVVKYSRGSYTGIKNYWIPKVYV